MKNMSKKIKVWLVTSEHLENRLWFREEQDFIAGMNYVAVMVSEMNIAVLAFILMSNHVHFLLVCTREEAEQFISEYKRRYSGYLNRKHGTVNVLRRNKVDIKEIPDDPDSIAWAAAYIINNSVAANICGHPSQYPWGSGDVYFNKTFLDGILVSSLSKRKLRSYLQTKVTVPGEWKINTCGYIHPRNYINTQYMEETAFRSPNGMNYYISNSSKAKKRLESGEDKLPSFRDQSIIAVLPDLYRSLFGKRFFNDLNYSEKVELMRQIRFRFSSNVHQIARVTGLKYEEAAEMLDSIR